MAGALQRLIDERAVAQLIDRSGRMAQLGSEQDALKLDWVMGLSRLLDHDSWLEEVEGEAAELWDRGTRHIIWSGMGGSVMAVRVLLGLGLNGPASETIALHPLDSTDPAALNAVLRSIAAAKGLSPIETGAASSPVFLRRLLLDVTMVGVSMGMTSEEPITHLQWFASLLVQAELSIGQHCLVMTLPGSYLERFADEQNFPARPLQLDGGTGTGGRMSAPTTRVFLLPAALALCNHRPATGRLRAVLRTAWSNYDLAGALTHPGDHRFVRLAAAMSEAAVDGACRLTIAAEGPWATFIPWIEQLMEESLGKSGKGVMVFEEAQLNQAARCYCRTGVLPARIGRDVLDDDPSFPLLVTDPAAGTEALLSTVAAGFLGMQLTMALYAYLQGIQFAGQPAVEDYKARARTLRTSADPLQLALQTGTVLHNGQLTLISPPHLPHADSPAALLAASLWRACPPYLDLTINGDLSPSERSLIQSSLEYLGYSVLGIPVKLRIAPAAYHSTEQSEMDGPPGVMSLRVLAREHEPIAFGAYDSSFLMAQAVGTWQAMVEAGRTCFLLVLDGTPAAGLLGLAELLSDVATLVTARK